MQLNTHTKTQMPQINEDVRASRLIKAQDWLTSNATIHKWSGKDLVLASAMGYFVPIEFRSATSAHINDNRVSDLMKAQGYKPREKKVLAILPAHDSDEDDANIIAPVITAIKRKYKKRAQVNDMALDEMLTTITSLSTMLTTLVKQVHTLQSKAGASAAATP